MADRKTKPADFAPVERETVMETVAHRIEALVRSGELQRGDRLPSETRLAEILKVSRPSLREALKGLTFLGLLKARAGDGTYLQPSLSSMVSRHFQWMLLLKEINYPELYELRQLLEPAAAALAARRATQQDLADMQGALAAMKKCVKDPEGYIRNEMEFHNSIMRASKNSAVQTTMRMMYGALSEGRHRTMPLVESVQQNLARHQHIFSLIAAHDAAGARRALLEDLRYAESLLKKDLQSWQRPQPIVSNVSKVSNFALKNTPAARRTNKNKTAKKKTTQAKVRKP